MDTFKARPLETLDFRFRPLAPHALSWSCDAELAAALDDAIHVFLPEFPREEWAGDGVGDEDQAQPQFSVSLQASGMFRPEPSINGRLCAAAGARLRGPGPGDEFIFGGVGSGPATDAGAALGQTVRVEWSPSGLGLNLRPVLAALVTSGCVVALGEHMGPPSSVASGATARSFRNWRLLWGLGACLPVPDGRRNSGYRKMDERIVSFSWAREVLPGRALLAYANDGGEVAIMGVQFFERAPAQEPVWEIHELARFDGSGPHKAAGPGDPEFIPCRGAFSLKWSPWHVSPGHRTAALAYVGTNYVGFRRVTISGDWDKGHDPQLRVEQADTAAICMALGADAFVEWEDAIWPDGDSLMARGIIATPFVPKPFQVDLCGGPGEPMADHSGWECSTAYAGADDVSTNPITGLIVHRPDAHGKPATPLYSLVRLSATPTNRDWYETNVPEHEAALPQWAEYVRGQTARLVPRLAAMEGAVDSDSDADDMDDEFMLDGVPMSRVHPYRFRFWGLASSPGGGCTAVLLTRHSMQHPHRRAQSRVLFGWREHAAPRHAAPRRGHAPGGLSTEGRLWEAVYGNQGDVSEILPTEAALPSGPLRQQFKDVVPRQRCVFCDALLTASLAESACDNGHSFATCAATGLAIMAPGVSRLCAVCGLRCLEVAELAAMAHRHGVVVDVGSTGDACGGCGGKFVA